MNEPTLRVGDKGQWVSRLQELLQRQGHLSGQADGDFGPLTRAAVVAFQEAAGLGADGVVGPMTWAALTGGSGGTEHEDVGPVQDEGPVPTELQEAGAPADLAEWTEEQLRAYFEGTVSSGAVIETEPEQDTVLAMAGDGAGDGGQIA